MAVRACLIVGMLLATPAGFSGCAAQERHEKKDGMIMAEKVVKSDEEWKKILSPLQYDVTRKKGTERAYTGEYWNNHEPGMYKCVCCGADLFDAKTKFDSGTGWPSFTAPVSDSSVSLNDDTSLFMKRTEVVCTRCGAHLGHVFDDGPPPTGLRYCMNSVSLMFVKSQ